MLNKLRAKLANFIAPNSTKLSRQFLRYGNTAMYPEWSQVVMKDEDMYTGYAYAAISKRANYVAMIATNYVKNTYKEGGAEIKHPYLEKIYDSPYFSEYSFWSYISTFLDLEGVFYLMAVRGVNQNTYGDVMYFKLLNPYNVQRVIKKPNEQDGQIEIGGYIETRNGFQRQIPPEMIIPISELNPFDEDEPYSMTDAAKESQFTLKSASDYTRNKLHRNINADGIITTDVILEPDKFANFVERVRGHAKGEPLFGNGPGSISYESMESNLKEAALPDINEMQRDTLFSVAGMSKTMMGIEQSGTTRETGKVQKDLFIEGEVLPRIQLIIDALNMDYRNKYPKGYERTEVYLFVDNPTSVDHDSEIKDAEAKQKKADLYNSLIDKGYPADKAGQYVEGRITIAELGEPEKAEEKPEEKPPEPQENKVKNQTENQKRGVVAQQEGFLKNAVVNIESQIVATAINRITKKTAKNQFEDTFKSEKDVVSASEKKEFVNELEGVLAAFYGIMISLEGGDHMRKRSGEYALVGQFNFGVKSIKVYIQKMSHRVAESHIDTVAKDIYEEARNAAEQGLGQEEIINRIKGKFNEISDNRAKTIARTEANRAFTHAQYEADVQFVNQNGLEERAYKKWVTRSDNPCPFCQQLASEPAIPLSKNFRSLGDDVSVGDKRLKVNFTSLESGNAHPNCSCAYELIIK